MTMRQDSSNEDWPARPWIMAAIGALGGLIVHFLVEGITGGDIPVWRQAATTFTVIAVLSFLMTVEVRRWWWALAFALGWGSVLALVGWFTAQYNFQGEIVEFPFLSGLLAVIVAAPLFQTVRDEGAWRFPYARLHGHAWTDAVIGAASLAFVGISFLMMFLIGQLFDLIGIAFIEDLLEESWFGWMLAGSAFGGAVGLLRERDALMGTLQRLVMTIFSVLAPVLAVALVGFLLSVPFTGLDKLWDSWVPATPLLLLAAAGAVLLANAVFGNGDEGGGEEDKARSQVLRWSSLALVVVVLPLAVIAALSMGIRVEQYGWTPERIWGVVAVAIALAYGAAGWWAVAKGRLSFDDDLRPLQTRLAIGLTGLALILALPILDFGAISARSQLARLDSGKVTPAEFDWTAMAFDFGPEGRAALTRIARSGAADRRALAQSALNTTSRYGLETTTEIAALDERVRLLSPDIEMTDALKGQLTGWQGCNEKPCALLRLDANRLLLIHKSPRGATSARVLHLGEDTEAVAMEPAQQDDLDLGKARVEVRTIQRRQAVVDGRPVGDPFE